GKLRLPGVAGLFPDVRNRPGLNPLPRSMESKITAWNSRKHGRPEPFAARIIAGEDVDFVRTATERRWVCLCSGYTTLGGGEVRPGGRARGLFSQRADGQRPRLKGRDAAAKGSPASAIERAGEVSGWAGLVTRWC